ncbi:uncharacterized protein [Clytia hemisphaerica]|uniref:uncharacterized protein n=1 Tax=Clytia hemisphaerica TaxID=252671 RepID=UPI0034D684E3
MAAHCTECGVPLSFEDCKFCRTCGAPQKREQGTKAKEKLTEESEGTSTKTLSEFTRSRKRKLANKQPPKTKKAKLNEVSVKIGLLTFKDGKWKRQGRRLPVLVLDRVNATELKSKAVKKFAEYDQNFCSTEDYILLYHDYSEMVYIPGTMKAFILSDYKENLGDPYSKIVFFLVQETDLEEYTLFKRSSSTSGSESAEEGQGNDDNENQENDDDENQENDDDDDTISGATSNARDRTYQNDFFDDANELYNSGGYNPIIIDGDDEMLNNEHLSNATPPLLNTASSAVPHEVKTNDFAERNPPSNLI